MTHATKAAGSGTPRRAWQVEVTGTVQGVGFRPFVHRLATGLGLHGWMRNVDGHVMVAVAGRPAGCLVAFEASAAADLALDAMHAFSEGADAVRIGEAVAGHAGRVVMRTLVGARRVIDMPVGEQLPRIG